MDRINDTYPSGISAIQSLAVWARVLERRGRRTRLSLDATAQCLRNKRKRGRRTRLP